MALTLNGTWTRAVHGESAGARRLWPADVVYMTLLAGVTFAAAAHFAPRGFRGGSTDMAHDGYALVTISFVVLAGFAWVVARAGAAAAPWITGAAAWRPHPDRADSASLGS